MAIEIAIPRLGWNMEEGTFVAWLKRDGDEVRPGEALFTLEGEKATEDIECLDKGVLRIAPSAPKAGDKIAVGAVIGYLTQPGEALSFAEAPRTVGREAAPTAAPAPVKADEGPVRRAPAASPRARRAARELGVDWTQLRGGGGSGRIRERDVRAAAKSTAPVAMAAPGPVRKIIADRMTASLRSTAPVTLTTTADASNLVNLRNQFKAVAAGEEIVPGYTDFLVKLAAAALQRHPPLAASWTDGEIVLAPSIDIGIAVDTEAGLYVPVIRDVPGLTLGQVAAHSRDLAERARLGTLQASEMRGGAFTITNLGAFGVDAFTPIINYPQCGILGVGRIQRRPVAVGDQITARDQVTLSLTFDHRIVDGAPAARFLQSLVQFLENPGPLLMT